MLELIKDTSRLSSPSLFITGGRRECDHGKEGKRFIVPRQAKTRNVNWDPAWEEAEMVEHSVKREHREQRGNSRCCSSPHFVPPSYPALWNYRPSLWQRRWGSSSRKSTKEKSYASFMLAQPPPSFCNFSLSFEVLAHNITFQRPHWAIKRRCKELWKYWFWLFLTMISACFHVLGFRLFADIPCRRCSECIIHRHISTHDKHN